PNVLTTAAAYPRAPWWQPDPAQVGSLLPTASLAGLMLRHGVEHAWLDGAIAFTWRALDALPDRLAAASERLALLQALYETRAALVFLDHTRERQRAEQTAERLGRALHDRGVFDGRAGEAELASPLDFATHPGSLARRWFDDARVEEQLDAMLAAQQADGGFPLSWHVWTPLAGLEWRGIVTLQRLHTLSAYGRLASAAR
ncbi:MAG: uncharacterized protein JWN48_1124, partial [Myxococcaceae bacterium]|nr:uncharacterized protein [Myxococcaceae bacterium]